MTESNGIVYITLGIQGPAGPGGPPGPAGPSVVIIPPADPQDGAGVLIQNGVDGVQDSGKIFNELEGTV